MMARGSTRIRELTGEIYSGRKK